MGLRDRGLYAGERHDHIDGRRGRPSPSGNYDSLTLTLQDASGTETTQTFGSGQSPVYNDTSGNYTIVGATPTRTASVELRLRRLSAHHGRPIRQLGHVSRRVGRDRLCDEPGDGNNRQRVFKSPRPIIK